MNIRRMIYIVVCLGPVAAGTVYAQHDLIPPSDPVYRFLFRQEMHRSIRDFYWGMLPVSRGEIVRSLDSLAAEEGRGTIILTQTENRLLEIYRGEFGYTPSELSKGTSSFLSDFSFSSLIDDEKQKYIYSYTDSTATLFVDGFGSYSYRFGKGDSVGTHFASLGELGLRIRGSLYGRLGIYLQASNGVMFSGDKSFADLDTRLKSNAQFNRDQNFFDFTTGYLRYSTGGLSVMLGREQVLWGMGYADRLVLSDNTVPFDYFKIDFKVGTLRYSFLHGSLVGADTNGHTLPSKYLAAHRLEFSPGNRFRLGLSEMVLYSNQPINFAMFNPFIFLTSAELSTELPGSGDDTHNTLIAVDAEYSPVADLRLFGSILIDDLKFSEIGKTGIAANTNKFGWHTGAEWCDPLRLSNVTLVCEYTRINPFVMSHWTDINSYTNWNLSLGSSVQPNSDEVLIGFDSDITSRFSFGTRVKFQRAGLSITDSHGHILFDAGDDILRGSGHFEHPNTFLEGRRVNRTIATMDVSWQPIRQYFVELKYEYRSFHYPAEARSLNDSIIWETFRVDF